MTIRNTGSRRTKSPASSTRQTDRLQKRKRATVRRGLVEALEQRQLMAAGPQLAGIQPNEGGLLFDVRQLPSADSVAAGSRPVLIEGHTQHVAPRELVFRFDDTTDIDPATLGGIRITRAGADGAFESATATTDFGTGGGALVEFRSLTPGTSGNGEQIRLTSVNRSGTSLPVIRLIGNVVEIELNSNPAGPTRVQDLLVGLQASVARDRIAAVLVSGPTLTPIGTTLGGTRTLTLQGANSAQALTGLGTSNGTLVRLIAVTPGPEGRGIRVEVTRRNFGGPANPVVTVQGKTIGVQINTTPGATTTVNQFLTAINSNPEASKLITAVLEAGSGATSLATLPANFPPLELAGAGDVVLTPGYVGLGDSSREIVFRFSENLPDDVYRIDVLGSGPQALKNIAGEAFYNGVDVGIEFQLNLGPQVVAVVPEPVRRLSNGQLSTAAGTVEVYFNDDDLLPSAAKNRDFYQLIFQSTDGTDLQPITPQSVSYSALTNIATLQFAQPLARLVDAATTSGAFRLRIGTGSPLPGAAVRVPVAADPGDSFVGATDLSGSLGSISGGTRGLIVDGKINNSDPFPFDLPGGQGAQGRRTLRPEDPTRLLGPVPMDYYRLDANGDLMGDADSDPGITVFRYNFQPSYLGPDPVTGGAKTYFNIITGEQKQRVREVMSLFSDYLGIQFVESESLGTTIVVGDLFSAAGDAVSGQGGLVAAGRPTDFNGDGFADLGVLDFQDFDESDDDNFGGEFSRGAMLLVGQLIGYGFGDDLPQPVTQSSTFVLNPGSDTEPTYPSVADILHGQHLYRPDSADVDLYRFTLDVAGKLKAETFAERAEDVSLLDSALRLYREIAPGRFEEVAANDDYNSQDSFLEMTLPAGTYVLGVSASGNTEYDPAISGTGFGGRSEGDYQLRLTVTPEAPAGLVDTTGVALDGDADGRPGGIFDFWYKPAEPLNPSLRGLELQVPGGPITPATIFVDKGAASAAGVGSLQSPFRDIDDAIAAARPGDIVRVVANGGADGKISTSADNLSYQIGVDSLGRTLADGRSLEVPKGVTMVVDAGAVLKFRNSYVSVGSSSPTVDRSGAALQVLGTPVIVEASGLVATNSLHEPIPGSVFFTSYNDASVGVGNAPTNLTVRPGDWGGIDFRGDLDAADESRTNLEARGIFLNQIYGADIRYGGGQVSVAGSPQVISPIEMDVTRPTVAYSRISHGSDSAIEATPDSFLESTFVNYVAPGAAGFIPDVVRAGPDIHNNTIVDNSINGMFIRMHTRTGQGLLPLTGQARFDDTDVVHVLTENLVIQGTPGGPIVENTVPPSLLIRATAATTPGGSLAAGTYVYRLSYVDANGSESPASDPTLPVTTTATGSIDLSQLPVVPQGSAFVSRRLYRATIDATGTVGTFRLAGNLNGSSTTFKDTGALTGPVLVDRPVHLRARTDARLAIDPGAIIKLGGSRIETTFGGNLIAEGREGLPIVMTSLNDSRYGAAGSFKTDSRSQTETLAQGDWSGLYVGFGSSASIDYARISGAGGISRVEGGFAAFNPIEVHQGQLRLAHSRLEANADGTSQTAQSRGGRGDNGAGTVFVRGAAPTILDNVFVGGLGAAISIDVNSFGFATQEDPGRSTGAVDRIDIRGNAGPLVRGNRLGGNELNGMLVRGGEITTEVVLDDTDIVHIVVDTITVPNQHVFGGLRLQSNPDASLVMKFADAGNSPSGIVVGGSLLTASDQLTSIGDRIGGSLQLVGQPDYPVVLTSLLDDTVGAGFTPEGLAQTDTTETGVIDSLQAATRGTLRLIRKDSRTNATFIGNVAVASDALGVDGSGTLDVTIPSGSTIEAAYLHVATRTFAQPFNPAAIGIAGDTIPLTWLNNVDDVAGGLINFETGRGDVTAQLRRAYANSGGGLVTIPVDETVTGSSANVEGVALTVIYSNSTLPVRTVLVLEGGLTNEQENTFLFDEPINKNAAGFAAEMRLGISFSTADDSGGFGPLQTSLVDINGQRVTSSAGGLDDGQLANGALITYGGEGDSLAVPVNPMDGFAPDDELYDLSSFLQNGGTQLTLRTANPSQDDSIFLSTFLFSGVVQFAEPATPGDWQGITIREAASDRNVVGAPEAETTTRVAPGVNGIPGTAQFLGELAAEARGGDENQRLGFVVDGQIATRDDLDVYGFVGRAGSEVWFDIDRTSMNFDSVIEVIDANGNVLASSDNSAAEALDPTLLHRAGNIDADSVKPMNLLPLSSPTLSAAQDEYSTNPRDAGFRMTLPGEAGTRNLYHVRVRSSNNGAGDVTPTAANSALVRGGLTKGSYRMQVRLREADEFPGTQVRFGDVRYGQTGLRIIGQPFHSPLLGEDQETTAANDSRAAAQPLGPYALSADASNAAAANLAASDRLSLSVGGGLSNASDVDWYQFQINYQGLPAGSAAQYLSTVFDLDYADGYSRADMSLYVFNEAGQLILTGLDSNIADDQPRPGQGADSTDLSRGSAGTRDPYIGMAELPQGTYFVAVTNQSRVPAALNQYYAGPGNPAVVADPLLRLEPISSVRRIAEDHIGGGGAQTADIPGLAGGPQLLFSPESIIPLTLDDLVMYTMNRTGNGVQSGLNMNSPFDGTNYGRVGLIDPAFNDFAVRPTGEFFGYNLANTDAGWLYHQISSETGAVTVIGSPGIQTFEGAIDNNGDFVVVASDVGMNVQALTFQDSDIGFFVADRPDSPSTLGPQYTKNILYRFDAATGQALSAPAADRAPFTIGDVTFDPRANGAGTNIVERGFIDTLFNSGPATTINVSAATQVATDGTATFLINDGTQFGFRDANGTLYRFEFNSGPDFRMRYDADSGVFVRDGDRYTANGVTYEFETGGSIVALAGNAITSGARITLTGQATGASRTFELTNTGSVTSGNVPVVYTASMTAGQVAAALAAAINSSGLGITADPLGATGRIGLVGESTGVAPVASGTGLTFEGGVGITAANGVAVRIEEGTNFQLFADGIAAAAVAPVTVGVAGDRVNFRGAVSSNDFSTLITRGVILPNPATPNGSYGDSAISAGATGIDFLASDSAATIAARVAAAVNSAQIGTVSATSSGRSVTFTDAVLTRNDVEQPGSPIRLTNVAPGGGVTGIAMLGNTMYAVSNAGGLYVITNPEGIRNGRIGTYVGSATDLLGIGFSGLSTGPRLNYVDTWSTPGSSVTRSMENLLFGADGQGNVYAFNTAGVLQPIFASGATSFATGRGATTGIEMSTLDYNLWHVTQSRRNTDAGHGINADPLGTRGASSGGSSLYFGYSRGDEGRYQGPSAQGNAYNQANRPTTRPRLDGQSVEGTYNFPGGASGAIESATFSLEGYTAEDLPYLYFNYLLDTDDVDGLNDYDGGGSRVEEIDSNGNADRDAMQVYVITPDGEAVLVSTNNNAVGGSSDDDPLDPVDGAAVRELFDGTGWRQARVPLSTFAGRSDLRLRIEFSTAGQTSNGSLKLRTVGGDKLQDGQVATIGGRDFELDFGPILTLPGGSLIADFYAAADGGVAGSDPSARVTIEIAGTTYVLSDGLRTINPGEVQILLRIADDPATATDESKTIGQLTGFDVATLVQAVVAANPPAPTTIPATVNFSAEPNDELARATRLPRAAGDTVINGQGRLGTTQGTQLNDVDISRIELSAGERIQVEVARTSGLMTPRIRLFNAEGRELASFASVGDTATLSYAATSDGPVYIGINSGGDYDPHITGSGRTGFGGTYDVVVRAVANFNPLQVGNIIQLLGVQTASTNAPSLVGISGQTGVDANSTRVPLRIDMTAAEVALALQTAMAKTFSGGATSAFATRGGVIELGGLAVTDAGPFSVRGELTGDRFGALGPGRAISNDHEGVYLDDFVIGFAERGEMVTGATAGDTFTANQEPNVSTPAQPTSQLLTGSYQLEIRDGSEYVTSLGSSYFRTFDTNDRKVSGATRLVAPAANQIVDGVTFAISDGIRELTFEFDQIGSSSGIAAGHVRVPFNSRSTSLTSAGDVARAIVDAINAPSVQSLLSVSALSATGVDGGVSSKVIDLFGAAIVTDPSGLLGVVSSSGRGDSNRQRDESGTIVVENSRFTYAAEYGIDINHGATTTVGGQTLDNLVRYPRNMVELNVDGLVPGVVVQSNTVAYSGVGGIRVAGLDDTGSQINPVSFDRIVNNTIVGGSITAGDTTPAEIFQGLYFPGGSASFADTVVSYSPTAGGGPQPDPALRTPVEALGAPDYAGTGEPTAAGGVVSLGYGGSLTLAFTDNLLTGDGTPAPDLAIFEVGDIESVAVSVSRDGVTFIPVGTVGGLSNRIDIDALGFTPQDRLGFVRLTDLRQGDRGSLSVGADIDAVGALSSVPADIYTPSGTGITVTSNAAPTLINNVIANNEVGIAADSTSVGLVSGANSFYRNTNSVAGAAPLGQFTQILPAAVNLFVSPANLVFDPASGAPIIDSSIDSLADRSSLVTVRSPLGLEPSPILAPRLDINGQLRVDDPLVNSPLGLGENVFKDRGAADRADQAGPVGRLVLPGDNDSLGADSDIAVNSVSFMGGGVAAFEIQLSDGLAPSDAVPGVGIDDSSVTGESVLVLRDNEPLIEGVHYRFGYQPSTNIIRLTPLAGVWQPDAVYTIRLLDRDDSVFVAVDGDQYSDGAALNLLSSNGQLTTFEVETGITLDVPSASGRPVIVDGAQFGIFDGTREVLFEIDTNNAVSPGRTAVVVRSNMTLSDVTAAYAAAINGAGLTLTAIASDGARIQLRGANALSTVDPGDSQLIVAGQIGVSVGYGLQVPVKQGVPDGLADGQTFAIRRGAFQVVNFEINTSGAVANQGYVPVDFPANATVDQIADALVRAIGGAGLGLSPVNAGFGRVAIRGDASHSIVLTDTALEIMGVPGQNASVAVPISIAPEVTAADVAEVFATAIDSQQIPGVTTLAIGPRVVINGAGGISGLGAVSTVSIRDRVGNEMQSNQPDGTTQYTIFLGAGFDYGDAPDPIYASKHSSGGPRHTVTPGFSLGPTVTPDADAVAANGDIDDGVRLTEAVYGGLDAAFQVFISDDMGGPFVLDYWVDWNHDGNFAADEKGISPPSSSLSVGAWNTILADAPPMGTGANGTTLYSVAGETFARFRLSREGVSSPLGDAPDGEVEDFAFTIRVNPFQNPDNPFDVSGDGGVSPIDILQVINALNRSGSGSIELDPNNPPATPPYLDVNGDGFVKPIDALLVLNYIERVLLGGGEAEGEAAGGGGQTYVSTGGGVMASAATLAAPPVRPGGTLALTGDTAPAAEQEALQAVAVRTSTTSVFDSPAEMRLDEVLDTLVADDRLASKADAQDSEGDLASVFDSVFDELGR